MKKPTHGGFRKGAGRKPTINAAKTIAVRLDAESLKKLEAKAAHWRCTPSEAIRKLINSSVVFT